MTVHAIALSAAVLHDVFDRALAPILTVEPGDTVICSTWDASWGKMGRHFGEAVPDLGVDPEEKQGHALTGPIAVRGAEPGDVLEVHLRDIRPGRWGWTWAGPRPHLPRYNMGVDRDALFGWRIDANAMQATDRGGSRITIPIRPFLGVMGNAPAEPGPLKTAPPRRVGGNLDCKELVAGSTLFLPVEVSGALFSLGDGHAVQGDGEAGQTGMECPMERIELQLSLRNGTALPGPQARTPAGYVVMGIGATLDDATAMALDGMLLHITEEYGIERPEALALSSLLVDLRVTQIVNGTVGVHAILAHNTLKR